MKKSKGGQLSRLRNIIHENPLIAFFEVLLVVSIFIFTVRKTNALTLCLVDDLIRNTITSTPLTDLGSNTYTRLSSLGPPAVYDQTNPQFIGGLYSNGVNTPPDTHLSAGIIVANEIQPLNASGSADPNGKIGFISIGMSNTKREFSAFMRARDSIPNLNPKVVLVNGAQTNVTSEYWKDPSHSSWDNLLTLVANKNMSSSQVQVAWVKLAQQGTGDFPAKAEALKSDLVGVVNNLKTYFPNIKIVFLSSRTHPYKFFQRLSPDPTAFETAFSVRWLIEDQIAGNPTLNYDPSVGPVLAPILFWGPYLWADTNPRLDGFSWIPEDLVQDCTHPSDSGSTKVADLLKDFFSTNQLSTPWFINN